jgi:transcriptional regulator GlxA family with amidase domain
VGQGNEGGTMRFRRAPAGGGRDATRLLCTTDAKTLDIAFGCGFSSVSSFYEMFSRTCGQSPGKYRRMARRG